MLAKCKFPILRYATIVSITRCSQDLANIDQDKSQYKKTLTKYCFSIRDQKVTNRTDIGLYEKARAKN